VIFQIASQENIRFEIFEKCLYFKTFKEKYWKKCSFDTRYFDTYLNAGTN
jgi:hypothetical protein